MGAKNKLFLVALLAFALAPACSDESGGTQAAAGASGAANWGASECGACVEAQCATEWSGCYGDPGCAAYLDCLRACPIASSGNADETCVAVCPIADSSATKVAVDALRYCRELGAGARVCTACGVGDLCAPELDQTCAPSAETNVCWKCQDEKCCETDQRCRDNQACLDVLDCLKSCTGTQCFQNCYAQHPDGVVDFGAKLGCVLNRCFEECAQPTEPCGSCQAANCACEGYACTVNSECQILNECTAECANDLECWKQCEDAHRAGLEANQNVLLCGVALCSAQCASG